MSGPQRRAAVIDVIETSDDRGAITVRAVPIGAETQIWSGMSETFLPGAFARAAASPHRVKLRHEHAGPVIGVATDISERDGGLWARFRFANTLAAQEARNLAVDQVLDQCSITFVPIDEWTKVTYDGSGMAHYEYARVQLLDVSLVGTGAYGEEAYIAAARSASAPPVGTGPGVDREARRQVALAAMMALVG
jgi:HK97 family phage prohead protease